MSNLGKGDALCNPHERSEPSLSDELRTLVDGLRKEVRALREDLNALREPGDGMLLTREEAADRLRISTRTLDDLEASGRLQAVRIGRRVLYHPDTLDAYIRSCTGEGRQHA